MKKKPNLFLISCPINTAHNPEEITTMIQPQFPGIYLSVMPRGESPVQSAIKRCAPQIDLRRDSRRDLRRDLRNV
jgi:hypothetical protein